MKMTPALEMTDTLAIPTALIARLISRLISRLKVNPALGEYKSTLRSRAK
jgi:hypothetical protein